MTIARSLKRGAAASILAVGAIAAGASTASALTYTPNPIHSGDAVTITSTATDLPAGEYRVSICTTNTYGIGVPACAKSDAVTLTSPGQVSVTTSAGILKAGNQNAHYGIGLLSQPSKFDCKAKGDCEALIVRHKNAVSKVTVERAPIEVN